MMRAVSSSLQASAARVALGVAVVLSAPLIAMQFSESVSWTLGDFLIAGVLLAIVGIALEAGLRRAGNLAVAVGIGLLGVAAAVFGNADDAPGLVLLGVALVASACVIGVRAARR
jgi:peptidoglycan/LPS O-acetylase OafA/YrhL